MSNTAIDIAGKPIAPRKDWPLTANGNGQWSKKHAGKVYYFGAWADWRAAEQSYGRRWPSIVAGLGDPDMIEAAASDEASKAAMTLEEVVNLYLAVKKDLRDTFRITLKHYAAMRRELTLLLDFKPAGSSAWRRRATASLKPADWAKLYTFLEDNYGPDGRKRMIALYRSVSGFGPENGHCKPFDFGSSFPLPGKGEIRAARRAMVREHGEKLFPREQIKPILDGLDMPMDAMFLLGINAGFQAADCGELTFDDIDLDNSTFMYDRVKTGVQRAGVLWPETVKALREAIKHRPKVNRDELAAAHEAWTKAKPEGKEAIKRWQAREPRWDKLVFITRFGRPWMRDSITADEAGREGSTNYDGVGLEFAKALKRLDKKHENGAGGMAFKRGRVSFGTCRHTYFTAAKRVDEEAAKFIMGHADESMGAWYDHLDDAKWQRLADVANGVYELLMTQAKPSATGFRFRPLRLAAGAGAAASA